MAYTKYLFLAAIAFFILVIGCATPPPDSIQNRIQTDRVVARADTFYAITWDELMEKIRVSRELVEGGEMSAAEVHDFLEEILIDTLAGIHSDSIDLRDHFEHYRTFRGRYYDKLIRTWAQTMTFDKVTIDSQAVVEFYRDSSGLFETPERVNVYHIYLTGSGLLYGPDSLYMRTLDSDSLAKELEAYAWQIKDTLDTGASFKETARQYSHEKIATRPEGQLGWVERGVYEDPFDSVAFNLEPGTYSDPYLTGNGWHILYVEDYEPLDTLELDSTLFAQIENYLRSKESEKLAQPLIDSLEQEINLVYNEPILDTNVYFVEKSEWVGILNNTDTIDILDLRGLEENYRRKYNVDNTTPELKREMIHQAARRYILVQAARAAKIDTLPEVEQFREDVYHKVSKTVLLQQRRDPNWTPPDSAIQAYYQKNLEEFDFEKPLVVQHIVTEDSSFALFLRDQARAGFDFLELAEEYYPGEASLRRDLADLGEIGPGDMPEPFYEMARITPIGAVSEPVKTEYGWHIIKMIERREPKTLGQARHEIVPILRKRHQERVSNAFRDMLFETYGVVYTGPVRSVTLKPLSERLTPEEKAAIS